MSAQAPPFLLLQPSLSLLLCSTFGSAGAAAACSWQAGPCMGAVLLCQTSRVWRCPLPSPCEAPFRSAEELSQR